MAPISDDDIARLQTQLQQVARILSQMGDTLATNTRKAGTAAVQADLAFKSLTGTMATFGQFRGTWEGLQRSTDRLNNQERSRIRLLEEEVEELGGSIAAHQDTLASLGQLNKAENALAQSRQNLTNASYRQTASWMSSLEKTGMATNSATGGLSNFIKAGADLNTQFGETKKAVAVIGEGFGASATSMAALAGPLTVIGTLIATIVNELFDRFNEARKMATVFGGTVFRSTTGVGALTDILIKNRATMAMYGISADQLGDVYKGLISTYALSGSQAQRFGQSLNDYVAKSTPAILNTMAMAKGAGMTDQQATELLSTFGLLGQSMDRSSESFARLVVRANEAGLNADDLAKALIHSAPAHIFATDAVDKTTSSLSGFAKSILGSNSALLDGANKSAIATRAINALADAAARMDLPQMLAFGAALDGMTGSIDDSLTKVAKMSRFDIMGKAFESITQNVQPGQKMLARTQVASMFGIQDVNNQLAVASGDFSAMRRTAVNNLQEQEIMTRTGGDLKRLAAFQGNLLQKIYDIMRGTIAKGALGLITGSREDTAAPAATAPTMRRVGQSVSPDGGGFN